MNDAVNEAFVRLFDRGLIYRRDRFVHYCCALQSVIADIEVCSIFNFAFKYTFNEEFDV